MYGMRSWVHPANWFAASLNATHRRETF